MNNHQLETLCNNVVEISRKAGRFLLDEIHKVNNSDIEEKGLHNFVSYVDKAAESMIVADLAPLLPDAGFLVEEGTSVYQGERFRWVVDPLDGTTNFIHRVPLYSISIALMEGNKTILGVVFEPNLNECFYAWSDSPAYLNGKQIRVSDKDLLNNALLATGFPYYDYGKMKAYMNLFTVLAQQTSGIRRLGSAAVDLAYTACGRFEGFYEYGLQPWDVAAGAFIVSRAGGIVTDFDGGDGYIFNGELLASNAVLHGDLLKSINENFRA